MKGAKGGEGSEGGKGEQRGAKGGCENRRDVSAGGYECGRRGQNILYTRFRVPTTSVGTKGSKAYYILGSRVPTTSVGTKGSKAYSILGFRVPTTSVGERGEGE